MGVSSFKASFWIALFVAVAMVLPAVSMLVGASFTYRTNLAKIDPAVFATPGSGGLGATASPTGATGSLSTGAPNPSGLSIAVVKLKDLASPTWSLRGHDFVVRSLQDVALRSQDPVVRLVQQRGGMVLHRFWLTNSIVVAADAATLRDIAQYPAVERIHANYQVTLPPEEAGQAEPAQGPYEWNIERVRAPDAWALGFRGEGVRVCITDTGVDVTHPDLAGRYLTLNPTDPTYPGGWIELDGNANIVPGSTPHDTLGHGTHVSGIVAGDSLGGTAIGVAPGATLMMALVIPGGFATFAQLIGGIEWCVNPLDQFGTPTGLPGNVQSMSWGIPDDQPHPEFLDPIKNSLLADSIPVVATGNEGEGFGRTPGTIWGAFGIGATNIADQVPFWSSGLQVNWPNPPTDWPFFGYYPATYLKPDFSAPGENIKSTLPGNSYGFLSGTSMATPHVAGTVAMMVQASAFSITPEQAYLNLQNSVVDFGAPGQDTRFGYGRLDAYQAVLLSMLGNTGVKGTVFDSETSGPLQDVNVRALELGSFVHTDANGTFRMGLPEGTYNISFSKFGYFQQIRQVTVTLYNGTLAGFVMDSTGAPILGASVLIVEANLTVVTDPTGYYEASVKAGRYNVDASAAGFVPSAQSVEVPENATAWANFTLFPNIPGILTGTVYNASSGFPQPNALIWAEGPGKYQTRSDSNGSYTIVVDAWNAGSYRVGAFKGGMWPAQTNVTVNPGTTTVADFSPTPSSPSNVAIYQDFHGQLAGLFGSAGWVPYNYANPDAVDLKWSLSAFPVVYWAGFNDNTTQHPTAQTFLDIVGMADALGVSIVFADSWNGYPYGIELLVSYVGDPVSRGFDYGFGTVWFHIMTDHPIWTGVGSNGSTVDVIQQLDPVDGDFSWFMNFTGTLLAHVGTNATGIAGDGVAVKQQPGGTQWILLGSLAPQFYTNLDNWYDAGKRVATNSLDFGRNYSWVSGLAGSGRLAGRPALSGRTDASTPRGAVPIPLFYVDLSIYLQPVPHGQVAGNVTDARGVPVADVRMSAVGSPVETFTDANGRYSLQLPVGSWTIAAKKFGYRTASSPVDVVENGTSYSDFVLTPQRRVGIMYDDTGNPMEQVLAATDDFAVAQFAGDWDALIAAVPDLDLVILSGRPFGSSVFPSQAQFNALLASAETSGTGIMFLDNIGGFSSPFGYSAPYGISLLAQYRGDPSFRDEPFFPGGNLFQEITARHPITRGFSVCDRPQLTSDTCSPRSWFAGFSGSTIGRSWAGSRR